MYVHKFPTQGDQKSESRSRAQDNRSRLRGTVRAAAVECWNVSLDGPVPVPSYRNRDETDTDSGTPTNDATANRFPGYPGPYPYREPAHLHEDLHDAQRALRLVTK